MGQVPPQALHGALKTQGKAQVRLLLFRLIQ
jgi:hypothetical protein